MKSLYHDLAEVYEAMYQTFIDYKAEYEFYKTVIHRYHKRSLLEIGSGTGNLAPYFMENGFAYTGLDFSKEMIAIAKAQVPTCDFLEGDMRNFQLKEPVQSAIITGRTISYLLTNGDVNATFSSIHKNLQPGGILCFDFIDANQFIPAISKGKKVVHEAVFQGTHYLRESDWAPNLAHGMDFKWDSTYYKKADGALVEIGQDHSIIRTFSVNEIEVFLAINGFEIREMMERASYAFPTYVAVAERID